MPVIDPLVPIVTMKHTLPFALVLAAISSTSLGQIVLLNETFSDLERSSNSLPSSAQWTFGAHNATAANAFASLDASSGALVWDHSITTPTAANSFSAIWAHFTEAGSPITLAVGETITLTFDVSFSTAGAFINSSGGFRFALFNSAGIRTATDLAGTNETGIASGNTFSGWRGYEGQTPISNVETGATGTNDFLTRERGGTGNGLFSSANWTPLASSAVAEPLFASATTYQGFLNIGRTDTGAVIQAGINGKVTNSFLDTSSPFVSFDTVAFFVLDGVSKDVTIDNVNISVVPEPSTSWILGVAALGLIRRRRR